MNAQWSVARVTMRKIVLRARLDITNKSFTTKIYYMTEFKENTTNKEASATNAIQIVGLANTMTIYALHANMTMSLFFIDVLRSKFLIKF